MNDRKTDHYREILDKNIPTKLVDSVLSARHENRNADSMLGYLLIKHI
jgi:hypothetical protein